MFKQFIRLCVAKPSAPLHRFTSSLPSVPPPAASMTMVSKEESRQFMSAFPDVVRDVLDRERYADMPEVTKWFSKVLQHNVPHGKRNRGLAVVVAYKSLVDKSELTEENLRLATVLGWSVEMLHTSLLIFDDVMDGSTHRRGAPCWYRHEHVGLNAINDALMLENALYVLLKKHLARAPCYADIINLMHDVVLKTTMGQCLDMQSMAGARPNFDAFTMARYEAIARYKTSYYTFKLPVSLAMYLAGVDDCEMHRQAETILLEIGQFFQIQDDYLDCFGSYDATGKLTSDIREGKCTWLAVVAMQRCDARQKEYFRTHYGVNEDESVAGIKRLYEELKLPHVYGLYESESYNLIRTHIQQISRGLPHSLFFRILDSIYKRDC